MSARVTRISFLASQVYLAILVIGSVGAATWMFKFFSDRGGFGEIFASARAEGLKPTLLVGSPIWLCIAAAVGLVLIFFLHRRKTWALIGAVLSAPAALAALYAAHRLLVAMEDRFYDRSKYVEMYRTGAYPLIAITAIYSILLAVDVLVVARRRAA
jgi:hypothetical protein